jgi:hypothetical protein
MILKQSNLSHSFLLHPNRSNIRVYRDPLLIMHIGAVMFGARRRAFDLQLGAGIGAIVIEDKGRRSRSPQTPTPPPNDSKNTLNDTVNVPLLTTRPQRIAPTLPRAFVSPSDANPNTTTNNMPLPRTSAASSSSSTPGLSESKEPLSASSRYGSGINLTSMDTESKVPISITEQLARWSAKISADDAKRSAQQSQQQAASHPSQRPNFLCPMDWIDSAGKNETMDDSSTPPRVDSPVGSSGMDRPPGITVAYTRVSPQSPDYQNTRVGSVLDVSMDALTVSVDPECIR